jgi:hypothetical protein
VENKENLSLFDTHGEEELVKSTILGINKVNDAAHTARFWQLCTEFTANSTARKSHLMGCETDRR